MRFDYDSALNQWYAIVPARDYGIYDEYRWDGDRWLKQRAGSDRVGLASNLINSPSAAMEYRVVVRRRE